MTILFIIAKLLSLSRAAPYGRCEQEDANTLHEDYTDTSWALAAASKGVAEAVLSPDGILNATAFYGVNMMSQPGGFFQTIEYRLPDDETLVDTRFHGLNYCVVYKSPTLSITTDPEKYLVWVSTPESKLPIFESKESNPLKDELIRELKKRNLVVYSTADPSVKYGA